MNTISPALRGLIEQTFRAGGSIRSAMRIAGVAKQTVATVYAELGARPPCGCGQPSDHRGWCRELFSKSPARQKVVKGFHEAETMQSNPMIDNSPKAPKVFMSAGAWIVPPEERPKGWETMGLREPAMAERELPNALRELPEAEELEDPPSLLEVLLTEGHGELSENIGQLKSATSEETSEVQTAGHLGNESNNLQTNTRIQTAGTVPPPTATVKWANIRPIVTPLNIGESAIVPVPPGIAAARLQNNLNSILRAWKETQDFKWSVKKINENELRVTKTGEHRSLISDLVRDRAQQKAEKKQAPTVVLKPVPTRPVVQATVQVKPPVAAPPVAPAPPAAVVQASQPVAVTPPIVATLKDAASECRNVIKMLDGKIEKIRQLQSLLEGPYIASMLMSFVRDSKGSGDLP